MQITGPINAQSSSAGLTLHRIDSGLHPTVWRLGEPHTGVHGLVLLEDGEGAIEAQDGARHAVTDHSLCWRVRAQGLRFRAEAGSTGYVGTVSDGFLAQLGADYADAGVLGFVTRRDHELALGASDIQRVLGMLASIHSELQSPRVGSPVVIAAQLRILLVGIARLAGIDDTFEGVGSEARFLQRFRELLEANFRAHWPVARYATHVGISHDRLHSLCTRKLGRTPKALIAERIAREAAQGLERSTLSLEQLSYALGFRDPAHFSHFFKRTTGVAPGAFRRMMRITSGSRPVSPTNFADWP